MPDLEIDNLTLFLLIAVVSLLLYDRFARPSALVHPLLLGKQAEVSPVRKEGESGVYRSFATGHGSPLIVRPASGLKTVRDVVDGVKGGDGSQRVILDTPLTAEALSELTRLLPLGLTSLFPHLSTTSSNPRPILVLLPPSPSTSLPLLLLSLSSSPPSPLIVLPSPQLLIPALEASAHPQPGLVVVHESLAEGVVEQVMEAQGHHGCGVLIVGNDGSKWGGLAGSAKSYGVEVRFWDEAWEAGENSTTAAGEASQPNDVHSYYYSSAKSDAPPLITKLTHLNFTAGIAGFLSTFPADKRPSARKRDIVASSEPLTTPMGMTIALAAIWAGAGFSLIGPSSGSWDGDDISDPMDDLRSLNASKPSILIVSKAQHYAITQALHKSYLNSSFGGWAINPKISDIDSGHLARTGIWEKLAWSNMRSSILDGLLGDTLRSIIVIGDAPSESTLAWSNLLLSIPTTRIRHSVTSAGPILASHFYDIQTSPSYYLSAPKRDGESAHTGAPVSNIEVVLRDVVDKVQGKRPVEGTRDGSEDPIEGSLWARGPASGQVLRQHGESDDGWVKVAQHAKVRTNGTFQI